MTYQFREATHVEGVALWRQIADALKLDIAGGVLEAGERLPGETALAGRFGVNRHTVRAALKALERDGVVRAIQGRGTFVIDVDRLSLGIPNGERLSTGIAGLAEGAAGQLLDAAIEPVQPAVASALGLREDELVTRMETVTFAGGRPIIRATSWFSAERFPAIDAVYAELGSFPQALRHYDILDYHRVTTRLLARHADPDEARSLELAPGAVVLVAEGVDALLEGQPIEFSIARFAAERVELVVLGE
ncbi:MAG TPA: phosphonate metabolism transcriptional regulator PhnF [Devosiaceae bacterium]|nr:phosphonate metabolism transcriptional regulator PhnF [Devosiaceae bacterium]